MVNILKKYLNKIKTFIYDLIYKCKLQIKDLLIILKKIDEKKLNETVNRNSIEIFRDWIIKVFLYGILLTIIITLFIDTTFIEKLISIIPFGLLHWLIFDMIKSYRQL